MTNVATEGYVTFVIGGQPFATPLAAVREIVRLAGVEPLPGMTPPMAGVLDLRGAPLPVYDIRPVSAGRPADDEASAGAVLVLEAAGDAAAVGVAVDAVRSVVGVEALEPATGRVPADLLPAYVLDVRRDGDRQVLVVDLRAMCALTAV